LFKEYLSDKKNNGRVITVFNPDVKELVDHPFNVTVSQNEYYSVIDEEMNPLLIQAIPITYYSNTEKEQYINTTHSELAVLVPKIRAYS
jgi:hypothetical protein